VIGGGGVTCELTCLISSDVRNTLQHTATHCNTLQHTATHCSTLQHTAVHCNTLLHTATHCYTLLRTAALCNTLAKHCNALQRKTTFEWKRLLEGSNDVTTALRQNATHCNTLQHTATHCYALLHPATHLQHTCNTPQRKTIVELERRAVSNDAPTSMRHTARTLQHTCNTLQHTATHCNARLHSS